MHKHGFDYIYNYRTFLTKNVWLLTNQFTSGVFEKVGYVTYPGKLTPQLTPSIVATLPVGCCNIVNHRVG